MKKIYSYKVEKQNGQIVRGYCFSDNRYNAEQMILDWFGVCSMDVRERSNQSMIESIIFSQVFIR